MTACPERSRRDAYTPSLTLAITTCLAGLSCLAQHLPPFLPTSGPERSRSVEDQSHAREQRSHPSTWRTGVDVLHEVCYHRTCMDTQLSKFTARFIKGVLPAKVPYLRGALLARRRLMRGSLGRYL